MNSLLSRSSLLVTTPPSSLLARRPRWTKNDPHGRDNTERVNIASSPLGTADGTSIHTLVPGVYTAVYCASNARMGVRVRCFRVALSAFLLAIHLIVAPTVTLAADVTVFAAASLKEAMDDQAKQFLASSGNKVVVSYGASNTLAKQIEAGAPADLFISADLDWMGYLENRHLVAPNARLDLLRNTLVLIAPSSSSSSLRIGPHFGLAAALGTDKLAMANPDSVPAGKYAKSALVSLGVWTDVEKQIARAENVRAALALVSRGEAPFGIVYMTDARADKG